MPSSPKEPDRLEKGLRLGCGGLFGLLIVGPFTLKAALRLGVRAGWDPSLALFLACGLSAAVCALLALRYGDRFWLGR